MSQAFTTVFGNEISVNPAMRRNQTQYNGYAGAHGVTGMKLGTRGSVIVVAGIMRYTAATYALARIGLGTAIQTIDATYRDAVEDTWTYGSESYANTVYDHIELVPSQGPDGHQKLFRWNGSACFVHFVAYFRCLI
ncbi:MAG: hypothetical protein LLF76_02240 [Planctomycetaceae bacterium]|nr:hypothetical protein [Planctomycetaceae bacterium]